MFRRNGYRLADKNMAVAVPAQLQKSSGRSGVRLRVSAGEAAAKRLSRP
jgi:hypothetical protein